MDQKMYALVSGVIFLLVALLHIARLIFGWYVLVEEWEAPIWVSVVGALVAAVLAFHGLKLSKKQ